MLVVVADTSPVRYLIQIDKIELIHSLFQNVTLPSVVAQELSHPSAPVAVRSWMERPPDWVTESI